MAISRYSDAVVGSGDWAAPAAAGALDAVVHLPGSKSQTNRELVLAALADGPGTLIAPLASRDTDLMVEALRDLGVAIERVPAEGRDPDLLVTPGDLRGPATIDCGLAGTVMRFVPPVAALATGSVTIDGDEAARRRPMRPMIDALRALGVDVDDGGTGALPIRLQGTGRVGGGALDVDASASSQFVSGLLLAAARFDRGLHLRHVGDSLPSRPHIEMTLAALAARRVDARSTGPASWSVEPGPIAARDVTIEPDLSNAAPFLLAALIAGGTVTVPHWPVTTAQPGGDLPRILGLFGAEAELTSGGLTVDGGVGMLGGRGLPGVDLDLSHAGELAPSIVAIAALASAPSRITGVGHLRGHETDRLAALVTELTALGGRVTELDEGLAVRPASLSAGDAVWHTYDDHRMATTGAILGLAVPGLVVEHIGTTAKTLPGFSQLWLGMLGQRSGATA